jgi:hypothetical protein
VNAPPRPLALNSEDGGGEKRRAVEAAAKSRVQLNPATNLPQADTATAGMALLIIGRTKVCQRSSVGRASVS